MPSKDIPPIYLRQEIRVFTSLSVHNAFSVIHAFNLLFIEQENSGRTID